MTAPAVNTAAARLYEALEPIAVGDELVGWHLLLFCDALTKGLQELDDVTRPDSGASGWAWLFDPLACPEQWLPWVAQFYGVTLTVGAATAQHRAELAAKTGRTRGTVTGVVAAIQTRLTGSKWVAIYERYQGDPYRIAIRVKTAETTLTAPEFAAFVKTVLPAGLLLDFALVTGQTYDQIDAAFATYTAEDAAYTTYTLEEAG